MPLFIKRSSVLALHNFSFVRFSTRVACRRFSTPSCAKKTRAITDWNSTHRHVLLRCQTIPSFLLRNLYYFIAAHQETIFIFQQFFRWLRDVRYRRVPFQDVQEFELHEFSHFHVSGNYVGVSSEKNNCETCFHFFVLLFASVRLLPRSFSFLESKAHAFIFVTRKASLARV